MLRMMRAKNSFRISYVSLCVLVLTAYTFVNVQGQEKPQSIGGPEHNANILGVTIGMDVPSALQSVFVQEERQAGQEKPDAKRNEGKDNKDVRVLYKTLKKGEMQILFIEGKFVKEIVLDYASPPLVDNLRLPITGDVGVAMSGERFDDRYSVGFTDNTKLERIWWRDEKTEQGYSIRITFIAQKLTTAGARYSLKIARKVISITPGDEDKFLKATIQKK